MSKPELLDYRAMKVLDAAYPLRPEIIESAYYLHRLTGDPVRHDAGDDVDDDGDREEDDAHTDERSR